MPEQMHDWGVQGAIHRLFGWKVDAVSYYDPRAKEAMTELPMAVISYHPSTRVIKGVLRTRNELQSYIRFADEIPASQMGTGWYSDGESPRPWIAPKADVTLFRPADSRQFEIVASIPPASLQQDGPSKITVIEDDHSLGTRSMMDPSLQSFRWELSGSVSGDRKIVIMSEPPRHGPGDPRDLGIAVAAIGYVTP